MAYDAIDQLRSLGIVRGQLSAKQEEFYSTLSPQEVALLNSINIRYAAVMGPEVVAHSMETDEDSPCVAGIPDGTDGGRA